MTKILHIVAEWGSGGVEKYLSNCADFLKEDICFDIMAMCDRTNSPLFSDKILQNGGQIYLMPGSIKSNYIQRTLSRKRYLSGFLMKHSYDIVHINGSFSNIMLYMSTIRKSVPNIKIIIHAHSSNVDPPYRLLKRIFHSILKRMYATQMDYCIACSNDAMQWMFSRKSLKEKPHDIIHCGIEVIKFTFNLDEREKMRKDLNLQDCFVVGTIGRICEAKNPHFILEIITELSKRSSSFIFLWVGIGEMQEEIRQQANKLGLENKILFYGTSLEIPSILFSMDVFILPSLHEGLSIACIEAQASGLQCFASNTTTIESKVTNLLYFLPISGNADEWAEHIMKYNDGYLRKNVSQHIINADFDAQMCSYKLKYVYEKLL